jgi:hypothetical protein
MEYWVREVDARKAIKESTAKPGIRSEREVRRERSRWISCGTSSLESANRWELCARVRQRDREETEGHNGPISWQRAGVHAVFVASLLRFGSRIFVTSMGTSHWHVFGKFVSSLLHGNSSAHHEVIRG